jgi:hypothetical protein
MQLYSSGRDDFINIKKQKQSNEIRLRISDFAREAEPIPGEPGVAGYPMF